MELDAEGRYLVLNAIANQLRHPSSHTHLYSFAMLYLFNEAKQVLEDSFSVFDFKVLGVT